MDPSFLFPATMNQSLIHRSVLLPFLAALLLAGMAGGGCKQQPGGKGPNAEGGAPANSEGPYYHGLIEEYRSNLAEDPHNLAANIALANALFDSSQWQEAIHYYEVALQLDPHNADVITDMGTCYRNLGAADKALSAYERALKVDTTHQNALFNMGVVYGYDKKDYAKAIAAWNQLLHVAPNHPKAAFVQESMKAFRSKARRRSGQ